MSNETKPLTAEEMLRPFVREHNTDSHWSSWDYVSPEDAAKCMEDFAAQQTAALREEHESLRKAARNLCEEYKAVKKERDNLNKQASHWHTEACVYSARLDEAVKLLHRYKSYGEAGNIIWQEGDELAYDTTVFLNKIPITKRGKQKP